MKDKIELAPWQAVTLRQPFENFCMFGGVATGKTFTGSHFALDCIEQWPGYTGLIGSNTYDQLSQATLREFLYWLDFYEYDYVVDQRPPLSWNARRAFKTYKNVMSIRPKETPDAVNHVFTRVMARSNPLRGIEFTWYWLDETRDTPQDTHDVVLSRLREQPGARRGLITSTTNAEDWAYQRFVLNARPGQHMYGSLHVPTSESVKYNIVSPEYYNTLRATYTELMAMQELDALHVNVLGGRAYYSTSQANRSMRAPWGDLRPNPDRPLIVGCDFNYTPSPCVWVVGQLGPDQWSEHIHWFGEISQVEASTPQMTRMLVGRYPNFTYRIYGDSSGTRGTTSNAGRNDYLQIGQTLQELGQVFTISSDQANPHVKDRIENVNRLAKNAMGEVRMTLNPATCPLLDSDFKLVGWKKMVAQGRAKLDDGGNKNLTHASDAAGYAMWKVLPLRKRGAVGISVESLYAGVI